MLCSYLVLLYLPVDVSLCTTAELEVREARGFSMSSNGKKQAIAISARSELTPPRRSVRSRRSFFFFFFGPLSHDVRFFSCLISLCNLRFVADEPRFLLVYADELSTSAFFARSARGKLDLGLALAVTNIKPLLPSVGSA